MQMLLLSLLLATAGSDAGVTQQVYVLGSSINLRKAPYQDAEVIQKLQIGTECLVSEWFEEQWAKVRCGEAEGYAAASLLGAEKPSVEKLKAESRDPTRTIAQREESALRASMLAPDDVELQKELGKLFFERNLDFAARLKEPTMRRPFSFTCTVKDGTRCLKGSSFLYVKGIKLRAETRKDLFAMAIGTTDKVVVYRGKYRLDLKTLDVEGEVLEQVEFPVSPVMEKAIFLGIQMPPDDERDPRFGQYVLDDASFALLYGLPKTWAVIAKVERGIPRVRWNSCERRPYKLWIDPDIHGRVLLVIERADSDGKEMAWVSAVSKRENNLDLTLEQFYGKEIRHEVFKLPEAGKDIAYLGERAYTFSLQKYPDISTPCGPEGGP